MDIKELKEFIKNLPDEMPVQLLDMTTDDGNESNYGINTEDLIVDDYVKEEGDIKAVGKMLYICFENKINENPI